MRALTGGIAGEKATYAYLLNWTEYNAPKVLYYLLDRGVAVKAAFKPFTSQTTSGIREFGYGSLVIPIAGQTIHADSLERVVREAANVSNLTFYGTATGFSTAGIDLGSSNIRTIQKPSVALFLGKGVNSAEAGQVWFLLSEQLKIPATKIDPETAGRIDFGNYTTLILVGGNYDEKIFTSIKDWVDKGGTLVTFGSATEWAIRNKLVRERLYEDTTKRPARVERVDYDQRLEANAPLRISGNILVADIDITNPVAFGVQRRKLFVNIGGNTILLPSQDRFSTVVQFDNDPLVNGYISKANLDKFRNKAFLITAASGGGSVILFSDDPTYRKYWHGTDRLVSNSIFFGNQIAGGFRGR